MPRALQRLWMVHVVVLGALSIGTLFAVGAGCSQSSDPACKSVVPAQTCMNGETLNICASISTNTCYFQMGNNVRAATCAGCNEVEVDGDCYATASQYCAGTGSSSGGGSGSSSGATPSCAVGTCSCGVDAPYLCSEDNTCYSTLNQIAANCAGGTCTQCMSGSSGGALTPACGFTWDGPTCADCISASCCSYWQTCAGDSACVAIISCVNTCGGTASCKTSCALMAQYPANSEYDNGVACENNACATACQQ